MSVLVQRDGVRIVTFQKCGHTSIVNMFQTPKGQEIVRGTMPAVHMSNDPAPTIYKGFDASTWPCPYLTLAFFREPSKRILSTYEHFIVRTAKVSLATAGRKTFADMGFDLEMTFTEFCGHLQHVDLSLDKHLKPQSKSFFAALTSDKYHTYKLEQLNT